MIHCRRSFRRLRRLQQGGYHNLSDQDLEALRHLGDVHAEAEIGHRKIADFHQKHPDFPKSIRGFPVVISYEDDTLQLDLRIPVGNLSPRELRSAARELGRLRKILKPYQLKGLLKDIYIAKQKGVRDSMIARRLNKWVVGCIQQYCAYLFFEAHPETLQEPGRSVNTSGPDLPIALGILEEMGIRKEEAKEFISDARKVISARMERRPLFEGYEECLKIAINTRDTKNRFVQASQCTFRDHRNGQAFCRPITAAHVRAKLRSLGWP